MKFIYPLIIILLIPAFLYSAHILIWEYDTLDIFFDPMVGDSVSCPHWIQKALDDNGHTHETYPQMPSDLSPYDAIFVTTGWFRC